MREPGEGVAPWVYPAALLPAAPYRSRREWRPAAEARSCPAGSRDHAAAPAPCAGTAGAVEGRTAQPPRAERERATIRGAEARRPPPALFQKATPRRSIARSLAAFFVRSWLLFSEWIGLGGLRYQESIVFPDSAASTFFTGGLGYDPGRCGRPRRRRDGEPPLRLAARLLKRVAIELVVQGTDADAEELRVRCRGGSCTAQVPP